MLCEELNLHTIISHNYAKSLLVPQRVRSFPCASKNLPNLRTLSCLCRFSVNTL